MNIANYIESELNEVAHKLILNFLDTQVWCFYAEMGAGKTTLIKEICSLLGVQDDMSSPTFALVNEYKSTQVDTVYHFDLYRLKDIDEAMDIGMEDYLYSGHLCLLEWPALIEPILPERYLKININLVGANARSLTADLHE